MKSELDDKQRIKHIMDACKKILLATANYDEDRFLNDFIVSAAVCNFVMIIGEGGNDIKRVQRKTYNI